MDAASAAQEYEKAARLRDQLVAVRRVIEKQEMVGSRKEDFDVIAMHGDDLEASIQTFFVRGGRVVGRKGFIVDKVEALADPELIHSFIETTYADDPRPPRSLLVSHEPASPELLTEWLSGKRGSQVHISVPRRGSKRRLMETVQRNAQEAFERHRMKRSSDFATRARALNELQDYLGLPEAPLRIECFDISNLGPTGVVASMVVFEDALPRKSDYRKFKIGGVAGQDDFQSMSEVIERRFSRFLKEVDQPLEKGSKFAYRPGLVVVDGGKGQLSSALGVDGGTGDYRHPRRLTGQAPGGDLPARPIRAGGHSPRLGGSLPDAADPRRGASIRNHLPALDPHPEDDPERPGPAARGRPGAAQGAAPTLRIGGQGAGGDTRGDIGGAGDRSGAGNQNSRAAAKSGMTILKEGEEATPGSPSSPASRGPGGLRPPSVSRTWATS